MLSTFIYNQQVKVIQFNLGTSLMWLRDAELRPVSMGALIKKTAP